MSVATLRRPVPERDMSLEELCRRLFKVVVPGAAGASSAGGSSVPVPANAATGAAAEQAAKARKAVAARTRALGE